MTDLRKQVEGLLLEHQYEEYSLRSGCSCGWGTTLCVQPEGYKKWTAHISAILAEPVEAGAGQLAAKFADLAVEMEKHSNDHIHDEPNTAAAVEGVCADRINAILREVKAMEKPHGPVSERFMRKHYGPSGFVKPEEPPAGEPRPFEQWWMDWRYKNPKEEAAWAAKAAWNAALATREAGKGNPSANDVPCPENERSATTAEESGIRSAGKDLSHPGWKAYMKTNDEVCQILGQALGYPRFSVCVGDHVAESIAEEAAKYIRSLRERLRYSSPEEPV